MEGKGQAVSDRQNLDNCVFHLGEMIAQIVRNINS